MKKIVLIFVCLGSLGLLAQSGSGDSLQIAKNHHINFAFTWFEMGASVPFKEKKLNASPGGMNAYLNGAKGGFAGSIFGLGLYYKNTWGLSAVLFLFQDYSVPNAAYRNYVASEYPGYFLPDGVQGHTYTLYKLNYRLSYRFKTGRFIYEPQFQLGINDCDDFDTHFVLKEKGSNNFIEYDIKKENQRKNLFSYHAALKAIWGFSKPSRKWNLEPGLRVDFMLIPTNFKYVITATPYNKPTQVTEVPVKRLRPALTISVFMSFFRK